MKLKRWIQICVIFVLIFNLFASPVAPTQADSPSGMPILVIENGAFGRYTGELLRTEGLNSFDIKTLADVTQLMLSDYELVILGPGALNATQSGWLHTYVQNGGNLLALRPDSQIVDLFGLGAGAGSLPNGYMGIQTAATFSGETPGANLTDQTLQVHVPLDQYALGSGTALATVYSDASTATAYPAVAAGSHGSGRAVAFLYDLPQNIVLTRQGNPANVNLDVDNDTAVRTIDLFIGQGTNPDWLDLDRAGVQQADEQLRLFSRLVHLLMVRPMPQLWYFPDDNKTMLILTGDAHAD
ncbi:MAG: hypothetical protein HY835_08140, partial [Anaerolineae bacterium]|nr:hypothetical protein [Anaerolineae bacterium]